MTFDKKAMIIIAFIVIFFLAVTSILRSLSLIDQAKTWLGIILLILLIAPFLLPIIANRKSALMLFVSNYIYLFMLDL